MTSVESSLSTVTPADWAFVTKSLIRAFAFAASNVELLLSVLNFVSISLNVVLRLFSWEITVFRLLSTEETLLEVYAKPATAYPMIATMTTAATTITAMVVRAPCESPERAGSKGGAGGGGMCGSSGGGGITFVIPKIRLEVRLSMRASR